MSTMPKKTRKQEYIFYVVTVDSWDHIYGLSVGNRSRFDDGPYSEFAVLTFTGAVVRPENFKTPKAAIGLSSQRGLLEDSNSYPKSIGMLTGRGDTLDVYVPIPAERMAELITLAASERVKAVAFTGTELKYRKGTITNIELMTEFIEEDW
jgi:hypothetical protein